MSGPFVIQSSPRIRFTTVEDAQKYGVPAFYPYTMHQLTAGQTFAKDVHFLRAGPITVSDSICRADVRMHFPDGRSGYHVNVPLRGSLRTQHRDVDLTADNRTAGIYPPHDDGSITRWDAGTRILAVKIDRVAVEGTLAEALGEPAASFASSFDLRGGHGRSWASLLRQLVGQLSDPGSVLHEPMAAMPFVESFVNSFLMVASPSYRRLLDGSVRALRPAPVRAAVEIIDAEAHAPLTVAELARRCHVSVRSLQEGFQRHLGTPPMAYLRSVRLARAHTELRAADPSRDTVSAIARRWGFSNLTRFANQHRMTFGEFPAETLRR